MAVMFLFCVDVFVSKESPVWWKWILLVFFFLIAVRMDPNKKTTSNPIFRLFFWLMFVRDLILSAILIFYNQALPTLVLLVFNCTVMLAEYAITIDTIPPRKDKKKNKREVYHESYSG
jgi:FtsH-binding integral membrane protein